MAKDKDKKSKDKKDGSTKNSGRFTFNPSLLGKTLGMLRSLIGASDDIDVLFTKKTVYCHGMTAKGRVILQNTDAISEGEGELQFRVPSKMWQYATDKKASATLYRGTGSESHYINIESHQSLINLHFTQPAEDLRKFKPEKGKSTATAAPLIAAMENMGYAFGLSDFVTGQPVPFLIRWKKGVVEAAVLTHWHGVFVTGKVDKDLPEGELTLPPGMLGQLSSLGGDIDMSGTNIAVVSDIGYASFSQLALTGSAFSIDSAKKLASLEYPFSCVMNGTDLATVIASAVNVTESGKSLTFSLKANKGKLHVSSSGRHGKVASDVDITDVKGKLPADFEVAPSSIYELTGIMNGPVRLSTNERIFKIEPTNVEDWSVIGYAAYFKE